MTPEQEKLVLDHLKLADTISGNYGRRFPYLRDEFKSEARLGLVRAAMKFDPGMGWLFKTFVTPRIIGSIKDCMRRETGRRTTVNGEFRFNVNPTMKELSEAVYKEVAPDLSLDDEDEARLMLAWIPERLREVVRMRLMEGWTIQKTAEAIGLSDTWVVLAQRKVIAFFRKLRSGPWKK